MSTQHATRQECTATDLGDRERRALVEYLTVLEDVDRAAGDADRYLVVSQSGREYLVDADAGACECPDHEYRNQTCKHQHRVAFATGERAIPADVDADPAIGLHVDGGPRRAVTDGGTVAEQPDGGTDLPDPLRQDATRCRLLGVDVEGKHHVLDEDRERVVVLDETGIEHQEDLSTFEDRDWPEWMQYVAEERGWAKRQSVDLLGPIADALEEGR